MAASLSLKTLPDLPPRVRRPSYARDTLRSGIVHFGIGNFHRAHMQVYLDRLFNAGRDLDWAIVGAGVTPYDVKMRDALKGQDWLSTVVEQSAERSAARVTGVMTDFLPPMDAGRIIAALADPAIRIVSLTVTEGGYFINPATGAFDPENAAILADVASPDTPKTVFGLILAGLRARRAAGVQPFTVLSCDNVPHNGKVVQNAVAGLAEAQDPKLAAWVRGEVAFPNGMVDRIAPATGDRERAICRNEFGIDDAWPVFCEDFIQWVLEDNFPAGRPALEEAGVTFVDDVTPFEHMKIRILNGGHAIIAYPSGLMDIHFVHEGMQNPLVRAFLQKVEREEILPVLPPVPGVNLDDYFRLVERRCLNPKIGDTIRRLCLDGSNRQPKFIIPTIADRLDHGLPVDGLALLSALWCRYCAGTTESGAEIEPNDPNWERLTENAQAAMNDPAHWFSMRDIYGRVADAPAFRERFAQDLNAIWRDGTEAALRGYLARYGVPDPPQLVIFDCDGVLVDSEPIAMRVLLQALEAEGLRLDPATGYDRFLGRSLADTREILAADFGLKISDAALAAMRQRLYAAFRAELAPTTGIHEALDALAPPFCVASSSQPERIRLSLEVTGLLPHFEGRIFSASIVARGKPAPDLFLHAAGAMGRRPGDCLVVEDSPAGIRAARAGGMGVVAFLGGSHAGSSGYRDRIAALRPDRTIADMRDLIGLAKGSS